MEKEVKPISPNEIIENLEKIIPPIVIQAVNNLLAKNYRGNRTVIFQDDIISEIIKLDGSYLRDQIFSEKCWILKRYIVKMDGQLNMINQHILKIMLLSLYLKRNNGKTSI